MLVHRSRLRQSVCRYLIAIPPFLLLSSLPSTSQSLDEEARRSTTSAPAQLNIGLLVVVYKSTLAYVGTSHNRLLGMMMAAHEINNKFDGIADDLLPETRIGMEWFDDRSSAAIALQGALEQSIYTFGGEGAHAVIGPGSSGSAIK
jgi:hypothetical protein